MLSTITQYPYPRSLTPKFVHTRYYRYPPPACLQWKDAEKRKTLNLDSYGHTSPLDHYQQTHGIKSFAQVRLGWLLPTSCGLAPGC